MFLRRLALPAVLLIGLTGALVITESASADSDAANVVVVASAHPTIVSTNKQSELTVDVRNDGTIAAAGVTVTLTLPPLIRPYLHPLAPQPSPWSCDSGDPVLTCALTRDLAPGESLRMLRGYVWEPGAQTGDAASIVAAVTTTTPESSTADNTSSVAFRVVRTGVVVGVVWNDLNADGIRQADEPLVTNLGFGIVSQDDLDGYTAGFKVDGTYIAVGPAKWYKLFANASPRSWRFTTPDVGSDATDSDVRYVSMAYSDLHAESAPFLLDPLTPAGLDVGLVSAVRPTGIQPAAAAQGDNVEVTFTGGSYTSATSVKLTRPGYTTVPGTNERLSADGTSLTVRFPVPTDLPTGRWTITIDDVAHASLTDAFMIWGRASVALTKPSITGTVAVGSTVRADVGTWSPAATSFEYQWYANGAAIPGATAISLKIPASMLGKRLRVKVTAERYGSPPGSAWSAPWTGLVLSQAKAGQSAVRRPSTVAPR